MIGLGSDVVEVSSIAKALGRDSECAAAWFSLRELELLGTRATQAQVVAGRVAAKEAVAKAIGIGFAGDVTWQDVEVVAAPDGSPSIDLSGAAAEAARARGIGRVLVTMSHTVTIATATAVSLSE